MLATLFKHSLQKKFSWELFRKFSEKLFFKLFTFQDNYVVLEVQSFFYSFNTQDIFGNIFTSEKVLVWSPATLSILVYSNV